MITEHLGDVPGLRNGRRMLPKRWNWVKSLNVVFFPGQVRQGKVDWKDLPKEDLWNGVGCGGSQKSEIAYLDMKGWDYVETDCYHFFSVKSSIGAGKLSHCH